MSWSRLLEHFVLSLATTAGLAYMDGFKAPLGRPLPQETTERKEIARVNGKYIIDTDTVVTLNGRPTSIKKIPPTATVAEIKLDAEMTRVVLLAFEDKE